MSVIDPYTGDSYVRDLIRTGKIIKYTDGDKLTPEGKDHLEYLKSVLETIQIFNKIGIKPKSLEDLSDD